jgi:hypothetical protein
LHSGAPLHVALSPSAQNENFAQHPEAAQPHVPGSLNTEWQSGRASHASSVETVEHACTQCGCTHSPALSFVVVQREKLFPVHVGQ